jgi:hypothetical protein
VGIGRAVLYDFTNSYHQCESKEGSDREGPETGGGSAKRTATTMMTEETNLAANIVMANFWLLMDSTARSEDLQNSKQATDAHITIYTPWRK